MTQNKIYNIPTYPQTNVWGTNNSYNTNILKEKKIIGKIKKKNTNRDIEKEKEERY